MKEGWTYKKLGEVCEILNGFAFKSNKYVSEGIRVIRITNVQKGFVEDDAPKFYPYDTNKELERYLLKEGDLLLSLTGNVGRVALLEKKYLPAYLNQRVACLRRKNEKNICTPFLFHLLCSDKFENDCISSSRGAAQKNMSTVWLADYTIPIPPLSEQQRIVAQLDEAFAEIDTIKAEAEKQLSEAKALFQKALSKAMTPKEGWEEKTLKDLVDIQCPISYGIVQQGENVKNGVPVVRPVDLNQKYIYRKKLKCTTKNISDSYKRTILRGGEILLSVRGTTGVVSIASRELKGSNVNRGIVPLFFKENIDVEYMYYQMLSEEKQKLFAEKTTGSTLKQINIKDLRLICFFLPPLSDQQRIVEELDELAENVKEIEKLNNKLTAECDAMKQALLRQVFE